ncbi:hypothetical protein LXJ58_35845, partial [Escherichia coli]|nr:hypothetical protein [Escherichia coli]
MIARRRRDAEVAEACRLIRTARSRPYRISDNRVMSDWSAFIGEQRSLLESLGSDPQLLQALQVRYQSDRRADQERASPPVAGNGPRIPDTTSAPVRPVEGAAQILGEHDREPVP